MCGEPSAASAAEDPSCRSYRGPHSKPAPEECGRRRGEGPSSAGLFSPAVLECALRREKNPHSSGASFECGHEASAYRVCWVTRRARGLRDGRAGGEKNPASRRRPRRFSKRKFHEVHFRVKTGGAVSAA